MKHIFVLLGLVVLLTACAVGPSDTDTDTTTDIAHLFGTWQLVSGQSPEGAITSATLVLDQNSIGGQAPCNAYGGSVDYGETTIMFSDIFQTLMYCEDTHDQEIAYFAALNAVDRFVLEDDHLILIGANVELRFERSEVVEQRYFLEPPCEENPQWYPASSQDMTRLNEYLDVHDVSATVSYMSRGVTCRACIDVCASSYVVAHVSAQDAVVLDGLGWLSDLPFPDEGVTN